MATRSSCLLRSISLRTNGSDREAFGGRTTRPLLRAQGVQIAGPVAIIDGQRPEWWRGAPDLFEDTEAVLATVLGYDRDVIDRLLAEGAIANHRAVSAPAE